MRAEGGRSLSRRAFARYCRFQNPDDGGADYLKDDIEFLIGSITDTGMDDPANDPSAGRSMRGDSAGRGPPTNVCCDLDVVVCTPTFPRRWGPLH